MYLICGGDMMNNAMHQRYGPYKKPCNNVMNWNGPSKAPFGRWNSCT